MNSLVLVFLLMLSLPSARAEDASVSGLSEEDYIGDVPRVLTVSRLSQPLSDAPSAVTVIDRETIRASGIVDLPEIFRLVPGFYVGINAGYFHNTNHAVSYHGMTSAYPGNMQVLINGRSVYSPLYGGVQWSELPLAIADIERIEITRGPNAASYGANSYFGVINIITDHPSGVKTNSVIATHGNGRNEAFYRHGGKAGALDYRVTVGYREDDGLDNRNDFKRTRLLNAQADYQINTNNSVAFEFGLVDGARGEGNINEDFLLFLPRTKQINNHYELIRWRHNISDDSDFSLQAYHSFDRSDDKTTSANLRAAADAIAPGAGALLLNDTITIQNPSELERYDIEAQHNFAIGRAMRVVWGGSIRRDSVYAPHYLGTKETDHFDLQRLFGHVEWHVHKKLLINAGAMIEHNDFTGTDISPRASINFKPTPNHTFRLGVSTALRTPNYVEEKFYRSIIVPTVIPNTALLVQLDADKGNVNPEQIISKEIGYLGKLGGFSLDARIFHDTITDHIRFRDRTDFVAPPGLVLIVPEDINNGVNEGSAEVDGFEAQARWQLAKTTDLLVNYAYVHIRETQEELKRDYTESMPRNTISALLTHRLDSHWDASVAYYQTSQATLLGDGNRVDLIRKCDVRLARKFNSGRWNGEVSAVVENLFNDHYEEFADYNVSKRRARINLKLDF
ncbi:MAG: TonB-dependent receptor plug domain-containing protein [Methylophilaceae bacterium]